MFNKKIAALLIVFMVCSWCLYAETGDGKDDGNEIAIAVVLGILALAGLIGALVAVSKVAEAPQDDSEPVPAGIANPVLTSASGEQTKWPKPVSTDFGNPILNHVMIGANSREVKVGLRFKF
jgi:hypothetical protein